jgi:hypothetical protein
LAYGEVWPIPDWQVSVSLKREAATRRYRPPGSFRPIAGIARTSLPESRRSAEAAFSRSSFYVFIQTKESSSSAAGGLDRCLKVWHNTKSANISGGARLGSDRSRDASI